jgi:hypothetical protein
MTGKITEAPTRPRTPISSWSINPILHAERLIILFLQRLFESAPSGSFRYHSDAEASELRITSVYPVPAEVLDKMPVIVTNLSTVGFQGLGMDQLLHEEMSTGTRTHVDLCTGYLFMNCLAKERYEALTLGWFVAIHTWALRRILMRCGFHDVGQRFQINPPSDPGQLVQGAAWPEVINVSLATPISFHYGVRVTEQMTHLLQGIEMEMTVTPTPAYRQTPTRAVGGRGTSYVQGDGSAVEFPQRGARPNWQEGESRVETPIDMDPFTVDLVIGSRALEQP